MKTRLFEIVALAVALALQAIIIGRKLKRQPRSRRYPFRCDLCGKTIESRYDLDWHGLGNCVEICSRCSGSGEEPKS